MEMLSESPGPCIGFVVGFSGPESLTFVPCGLTARRANDTMLNIHQSMSRQLLRGILGQGGENHER